MVESLRSALELLRARPGRALLVLVLGVGAQLSALGLAAVAAWLIARAWQMPPVLELTVAVVAVRALGLARGGLRYAERLVSHDLALRGATDLRVDRYRRLAAADPGSVVALDRGELVLRFGRDIDELTALVVRAAVPIVVAAITSLAAVALLAAISLPAAAALLAGLVLSGALGPIAGARASRAAEQAAAVDRATAAGRAALALDHAAELRVGGRLTEVVAQAAGARERAGRRQQRARARSAYAAAVVPAAQGAVILTVLWIGYAMTTVPLTEVRPTALVVLMLFPLAAFEAVGQLPAAAQALVAIRAPAPLLPVSGRRPVELPEVSVGCRVAIVGPSGSGKTTLLLGLAEQQPGATFFAEDAHVFETSVLENLRVGRGDVTPAEAVRALTAVGLGGWVAELPDGLDTDLIGGAAALSGGQRRRLLLARALLAPAQILLLDEPTEHLDAEQGADLVRALLDRESGLVAAERGVVLVTHQLPPDHRADRVLRMDMSTSIHL
ncbi:ATP-binding cassette domain-containing protein [Skermania piniformis]|uniref:ATP-binding cassette domain-containing protein n=1 Tax=Skermania pinensis TaxID=39122 RepID=A0ABX8SCN8_9ACTN|nr:ATP-binding cassette domain-containing protein [Skermania piniformis]QXQ13456.1 ATP-binding cassette domain-containing protein [Skermania piniformis]